MSGYIGPQPVVEATQNRESFTAAANQNSFATAGYQVGYLDIFLNGVKLAPADYTATNGSDVVLAANAAAGDILEVTSYSAFSLVSPDFTGDTTAVNLTVTGNLKFSSLSGTGSVAVTDILDEDNMASNSPTKLSTQQAIKAYVDSSSGAGLPLSGGAMTGNVTFGDNNKAIFGAGSDLQIYSDGTTSRIYESGSGLLTIRASNFNVNTADGSESYITMVDGGAVTSYHNGAAKIATTSTGIDVTGTAVTDGLTVAGNLSVDGGTIKLDGNYPVGTGNVALGDAAGAALTTGTDNVSLGHNALYTNTTSSSNTAIGSHALYANTGASNTALGRQALRFNSSASNNTAVGYQAAFSNTTGAQNTAIGRLALDANTTASENTAVGNSALGANTTGASNSALGSGAMTSNTTGATNVAIGDSALYSNTTASSNTAVGYQAAYSITGSQYNTAIGRGALYSHTTGNGANVALGYDSSRSLTTGAYNVSVGTNALYNNTTGNVNTAVGYRALLSNTTGYENTAIGPNSLKVNTTGLYNTAVGSTALFSNTTASYNTAVGYQSLTANTEGYSNVAVGNQSMLSNITGINNTATGRYALYNNTTGGSNVAVGLQALFANTTAVDNTAVGYLAGSANTTGAFNTFIGKDAGKTNTTGTLNSFIGEYSGRLTTGSNNTFLGQNSGSGVTSGTKNTIIGRFGGNGGGVDILTGSNNIVLSDGDGNPRVHVLSSGNMFVGRAQESTWTEGFGVESVGSGSAGTYLITAHKSGVASGRPYHYFFYNNSVIGTILQTGTTGVAYNTSSDYRLKENVVYDWDATTRLKQLKPARFNFITEADRTVDGFLAHEAQAVVPEAVHGTHNEVDDDGAAVMQGIDQSKLVPLLVKTIQELEARITALEDV